MKSLSKKHFIKKMTRERSPWSRSLVTGHHGRSRNGSLEVIPCTIIGKSKNMKTWPKQFLALLPRLWVLLTTQSESSLQLRSGIFMVTSPSWDLRSWHHDIFYSNIHNLLRSRICLLLQLNLQFNLIFIMYLKELLADDWSRSFRACHSQSFPAWAVFSYIGKTAAHMHCCGFKFGPWQFGRMSLLTLLTHFLSYCTIIKPNLALKIYIQNPCTALIGYCTKHSSNEALIKILIQMQA